MRIVHDTVQKPHILLETRILDSTQAKVVKVRSVTGVQQYASSRRRSGALRAI